MEMMDEFSDIFEETVTISKLRGSYGDVAVHSCRKGSCDGMDPDKTSIDSGISVGTFSCITSGDETCNSSEDLRAESQRRVSSHNVHRTDSVLDSREHSPRTSIKNVSFASSDSLPGCDNDDSLSNGQGSNQDDDDCCCLQMLDRVTMDVPSQKIKNKTDSCGAHRTTDSSGCSHAEPSGGAEGGGGAERGSEAERGYTDINGFSDDVPLNDMEAVLLERLRSLSDPTPYLRNAQQSKSEPSAHSELQTLHEHELPSESNHSGQTELNLSSPTSSHKSLVKGRTTPAKQSWLLRLFESKLFDMSIAIQYLFNSKEPGVQTYLGNYS